MLRPATLAVVIAAALAIAGAAQAQHYASAPSVAPVGKTVTVSGGGVAAGSVVSIRVTAPSGVITILATVADSEGKFSHGVTAGAPGTYRVELLAANNQRFADLRMMAAAAN